MGSTPEFFPTKSALAKRAAQICSNPSCRRPTSGPHHDPSKALNLGEAAHIRGAHPGSARFDSLVDPALETMGAARFTLFLKSSRIGASPGRGWAGPPLKGLGSVWERYPAFQARRSMGCPIGGWPFRLRHERGCSCGLKVFYASVFAALYDLSDTDQIDRISKQAGVDWGFRGDFHGSRY